MKEKNSFIFYYDWYDIFEPLSDEQKGLLLSKILGYVKDGKEDDIDDLALKISFNVIRNALNRDGEKYKVKCLKNAENGKKGGRPKKQPLDEDTEKSERLLKKAKKADNDNDTDNDTDNDNDNDNDTDNDNDADNDTDNDTNDNINNKSTSSFSAKKACVYSDDFLVFWKEYPKKVGKGAAFKAWRKSGLNSVDEENILSALKWQKKSEQWKLSNGRFIPNPTTYINQRRWEDEPCDIGDFDITDPSGYNECEDLPDYILEGDYL